MNNQDIKKLIIGLAEVFGEQLTATRVQVYAQMLSDFSAKEVESGIKRLLESPTTTRFPLPAQIREAIKPTLSIDIAAQELLQRCVRAATSHGYANPTEAKHFVGEIAWRSLGGQSGWVQFCCAGDWCTGGIEIGTARAQLRESIKAKLYQDYPTGRVDLLPPPQTGPKLYLPVMDLEDVQLKKEGFLTNEERGKRLLELRKQIETIGKPVRE